MADAKGDPMNMDATICPLCCLDVSVTIDDGPYATPGIKGIRVRGGYWDLDCPHCAGISDGVGGPPTHRTIDPILCAEVDRLTAASKRAGKELFAADHNRVMAERRESAKADALSEARKSIAEMRSTLEYNDIYWCHGCDRWLAGEHKRDPNREHCDSCLDVRDSNDEAGVGL